MNLTPELRGIPCQCLPRLVHTRKVRRQTSPLAPDPRCWESASSASDTRRELRCRRVITRLIYQLPAASCPPCTRYHIILESSYQSVGHIAMIMISLSQ